jgi:preprotein translocase subunit YajC
MDSLLILAQGEVNEAPQSIGSTPVGETTQYEGTTKQPGGPDANLPGDRTGPGGLFKSPLIFLILVFVIFYFFLLRGPRKKQQQHRQMVQALQKNDRVRTIGGIIGTVVDVKDDEVVLKVDESNNTKMRFAPSAIGKNLSKEEK